MVFFTAIDTNFLFAFDQNVANVASGKFVLALARKILADIHVPPSFECFVLRSDDSKNSLCSDSMCFEIVILQVLKQLLRQHIAKTQT